MTTTPTAQGLPELPAVGYYGLNNDGYEVISLKENQVLRMFEAGEVTAQPVCLISDALAAVRAAQAAQPDLHTILKDVVSVAIAQLYEQHTADTLAEFPLSDLEIIVENTEPLRPQLVEKIYRRGFDAVYKAQAAQPAAQDRLLQIIAATYQIAGACDVPVHILDVLANPEMATQEQIDAMLPFAQPERKALSDEVDWKVFIDNDYIPNRLRLSIGVQTFDIRVDYAEEEPGRLEWHMRMLQTALERLTPAHGIHPGKEAEQ